MKNFIALLLLCVTLVAASGLLEEKSQSSAPTVNSTQFDLSQHFCRLWRHQSVYAQGKIYIDGGNTYVPRNGGNFNTTPAGDFDEGMNTVLLVLDLSQNFTSQDNFPYQSLDKGPDVPNGLVEGALWFSPATRKVYQVGGWYSLNNVTNPAFVPETQVPESAIWEFDIDTQIWAESSFTLVNAGSKVDRPGAAAYCTAPLRNQSYIFEGFVQRRSDHDYSGFADENEYKFVEGMLTLDTTTSPPTLTNTSVPTYMGPRMNGAMVHIPIGKQGVIVQIGGETTQNATPFGVGVENAESDLVNIDMNFVDVLDMQSGYWFRQQTFGVPDLPTGRSDICTVFVNAPDGTSHNIFMIAGIGTYGASNPYEEMWVLTLPTFQWKKVHTREGGRWGQTCHIVGQNLLVIGGMETNSSGGPVNTCSDHMVADVFDLVTMNYTGIFNENTATLNAPIPADIVALIGGTSSGGAVVQAPKVWSDAYLQYVFDPSLVRPAYTPNYTLANSTSGPTTTNAPNVPVTSPSASSTSTASPLSSSKVNAGAIAGGVIGGLALIAVVSLTILFFLKHRRGTTLSEHSLTSGRPSYFLATTELPSYIDDAKSDAAVEVPAHDDPPFSSFYVHNLNEEDPAELHAEEQDKPRSMSTRVLESEE